MNRVIVEIGSNINPQKNIAQAKSLIQLKYPIIRESKFVKTRPIGPKIQKDSLNGSVLVETSLTEAKFKEFLRNN